MVKVLPFKDAWVICQYDFSCADELQTEWFTLALKTIKSVVETTLACSSVLLKFRLIVAEEHEQLTKKQRIII